MLALKLFGCQKHLWILVNQTARMSTLKWRPVVGLEIHAQIVSESKLFSDSGVSFASPPNKNVSFIDVALPGTLPVLNRRCVEAGVLTALALNCKINKKSWFDRKHYFYSDLPAGYQITQQHTPIAIDGYLEFVVFNSAVGRMPQPCKARIKQIQLEQDSGKSMHDKENQRSLVDLNRAGIGLMELVFEPDLVDGEEAAGLVKELTLILERLGVCSCLMEEGALRVDANVSVHQEGQPLGVRTEVKNLNSIRAVQKAIDYEIKRQTGLLEKGEPIINQTLSFDTQTKKTVVMRDKESLLDYRFMPEPNLLPLKLKDSSESDENEMQNHSIIDINELRIMLPVMPKDDRQTLMDNYKISLERAVLVVNCNGCLEFFKKIMEQKSRNPHLVLNWLLNSVLGELNEKELTYSQCPVDAELVGELIDLLKNNQATSVTANKILSMLFNGDTRAPLRILVENDWVKITDETLLEKFCLEVMQSQTKEVEKYLKGNKRALKKLIKGVSTLTNDRVDLTQVTELLDKLLEK